MSVLPFRIAITPGEPAGIGPDVVVQLAQQVLPAQCIVIADKEMLSARAMQLNLPLKLYDFEEAQTPQILPKSEITVLHVPLSKPSEPGKFQIESAEYVINTLNIAAKGCLNNQFAALVTGPVHKGHINNAGIPFRGHTELLAKLTSAKQVVMMLVSEAMRVALVTTHVPLKEVSEQITSSFLENTLRLIVSELQKKFGIKNPRMGVCGINPHAGDLGHIGREEIEIMQPVLEKLRHEGMQLMGPLGADTLFTPYFLPQLDVVVAMYHDQGLPVLKYQSFGHAVNVTLGLPIVRASVDHGTAIQLAGTGQSDPTSLMAALHTALDILKYKS